MPGRPPTAPPRRSRTIRDALREALRECPADARTLSARVGVPERDVAEHLAHLARSLARDGEHLAIEPARCLACGFVFRRRERLTRPSACPECRGTHLDPPTFRIDRR